MAAELTHDDNLYGLDELLAYGLNCTEHPPAKRVGLTLRHAQNAVAKHNRDHHAQDDLPDLVRIIQEAGTGEGLNLADARVLAATILNAGYAKPPF